MDRDAISTLLHEVAAGRVPPDAALEALRNLPFENLGFAHVDHHRSLRTGFPEVVFCQGKTVDQVAEIVANLTASSRGILATRASDETASELTRKFPHAEHNRLARTVFVRDPQAEPDPGTGMITVLSAGTSDMPVAEEAVVTARAMGARVESIYDVGVAGIHRLLAYREKLDDANVIVVCAGMEGALPSVVGGLVAAPVIAVPTSVGYGASLGGIAALLAMLNSCASGVTVVNIDNGFGAGYAAALINRLAPET